ncbi:RhoGAP domain-containing protein [Planoprotostelium fungivorum]|uniref:RhoGAP domain-containing protein n=1 Tax=Planoprotostelium fungivorum TaxID=1890364 RepID=A0A2P6N7V0_9EUKA|nr:RhoGAP domain-containing protein [Planoprotostelium fungivorum]
MALSILSQRQQPSLGRSHCVVVKTHSSIYRMSGRPVPAYPPPPVPQSQCHPSLMRSSSATEASQLARKKPMAVTMRGPGTEPMAIDSKKTFTFHTMRQKLEDSNFVMSPPGEVRSKTMRTPATAPSSHPPSRPKEQDASKSSTMRDPRRRPDVPPMMPARPSRPRVIVTQARPATDSNELSLRVNDTILLKEVDNNLWARGILELTGKEGWFPLSIVTTINDEANGMIDNAKIPSKPETSPVDMSRSSIILESKISARPDKEDLQRRHILQETAAAPVLQEASKQLEKQRIGDVLSNFLRRKSPDSSHKTSPTITQSSRSTSKQLQLSKNELNFNTNEMETGVMMTDSFQIVSPSKTKYYIEHGIGLPNGAHSSVPPCLQLSFEPAKGSLQKNKAQIIRVVMTVRTYTDLKEVVIHIAEGEERKLVKIPIKLKLNCLKGIFGSDPSTIPTGDDDDTGLKVPVLLSQLKQKLREDNGMRREGIFRISGEAREIADAKKKINRGTPLGRLDPHVSSNLIKIWFREMPDPLLQCARGEELHSDDPAVLSNEQRHLLEWLVDLMKEVAASSEDNKMTVENLAIVIAPNLYRIPTDIDPAEGLTRAQRLSKFFGLIVNHLEQLPSPRNRQGRILAPKGAMKQLVHQALSTSAPSLFKKTTNTGGPGERTKLTVSHGGDCEGGSEIIEVSSRLPSSSTRKISSPAASYIIDIAPRPRVDSGNESKPLPIPPSRVGRANLGLYRLLRRFQMEPQYMSDATFEELMRSVESPAMFPISSNDVYGGMNSPQLHMGPNSSPSRPHTVVSQSNAAQQSLFSAAQSIAQQHEQRQLHKQQILRNATGDRGKRITNSSNLFSQQSLIPGRAASTPNIHAPPQTRTPTDGLHPKRSVSLGQDSEDEQDYKYTESPQMNPLSPATHNRSIQAQKMMEMLGIHNNWDSKPQMGDYSAHSGIQNSVSFDDLQSLTQSPYKLRKTISDEVNIQNMSPRGRANSSGQTTNKRPATGFPPPLPRATRDEFQFDKNSLWLAQQQQFQSNGNTMHMSMQNSGRLILRQQPNLLQRKCYMNENRENVVHQQRIVDGTITVYLCDSNGIKVNESVAQLECTTGSLQKKMEISDDTNFSLKLHCASTQNRFRLQYEADYTTEDMVHHQEVILSDIFQVHSNKSLASKCPKITDILPKEGIRTKSHETWIKGKDFNPKGIRVTFDEMEAEILEISPTLLSVRAPARNDLTCDTMVKVQVWNQFANKLVNANDVLCVIGRDRVELKRYDYSIPPRGRRQLSAYDREVVSWWLSNI